MSQLSAENERLAQILEIIFRFAAGDLKARGTVLGDETAVDGVMAGVNILGEELEAKADEIERANGRLRQALDYAQALIRSSPDGILAVNRESMITEWNRQMELIVGMAREQTIGRTLDEVPFMRETGEAARIRESMRGSLIRPREFAYRRHGMNEEQSFESSVASLTESGKMEGAVIRITNISDRKRAERAEELARRDGLTNLFNHRTFTELLEDEVARTRRFKRPMSLLMLDIDHFKRVNDSYGHQAGDAILKGLSDLLLKQSRAIDRACRYGGEEFAVILPETDAAVAMQIAERLRAEVERQAFDIGGRTINMTVSVGVATYSPQADSPEGLVKAADIALYTAKHAGRNRVARFRGQLARHAPAT